MSHPLDDGFVYASEKVELLSDTVSALVPLATAKEVADDDLAEGVITQEEYDAKIASLLPAVIAVRAEAKRQWDELGFSS